MNDKHASPASERETHKKSDEDPDHLVHATLCEVCHKIKQQRNTDRGELRKFRAEVESLRAERQRLGSRLESALSERDAYKKALLRTQTETLNLVPGAYQASQEVESLRADIREYVDECPMCRAKVDCEDVYCAKFREALSAGVGKMNEIDAKWISALKRYWGEGKGPVPFYRLPDGSVDAVQTLDRLLQAYGWKPLDT
jgi:hypothetical protein